MSDTLLHISSIAIWGSLLSSLVLGTFLLAQMSFDRDRRVQFFIFAIACLSIAVVDFFHGFFTVEIYERLRVAVWSLYPMGLILLIDNAWRKAVISALMLYSGGMAIWYFWEQSYASSWVVAGAFFIAASAHYREYRRHSGYASSVLMVLSCLQGLLCAWYIPIVSVDSPQVTALGYTHYAILSVLAVIFGWVHLPRELKGKAPVKSSAKEVKIMASAAFMLEVGVLFSLMLFHSWPPYIFLALNTCLVAGLLWFFFLYRHRLVIYTDNVAELLDKRTYSLQRAREELAAQNEIQAKRLKEQECSLRSRAEVIERQRRLELAAQTAGQAAHDIQNHLSPVEFECTRLERVLSERHGGEFSLSLQKIRKQISMVSELNHQLLSLSRRGRKEVAPLLLSELLESIVESTVGQPVTLEENTPVVIEGSWTQLSRVVLNLVRNALDAVQEKGDRVSLSSYRLTVQHSKRCHLGYLAPGNYGVLRIEDNGPGIPEDKLESIFQPFFSTKSRSSHSGTGLGLSIVSAIVEDHNGVLDLRTSWSGTTFELYFPEAPLAHVEGGSSRELLCGNETVLVIDDDHFLLTQCCSLLKAHGYTVKSARDGNEGLRIAQQEKIQLVVLDLSMPEKDGTQVFFELINIQPHLRAICYTGFLPDDSERKLRALGITTFLIKPTRPERLLQGIRQELDSSIGGSMHIRRIL